MTLRERAVALLHGAVDGTIDREQAHALARDWLDAGGGNIALAVLTGGEHEAARIMELCDTVLALVGTSAGDNPSKEVNIQ